MSNTQKEMPEWFDGKKINEILFCEAFRKEHPMICINDQFFTVDGLIADPGKLEAEIFNTIRHFVTEKVSNTVKSLMGVLKLMCHSEPLTQQTDRIHVANGTYYLDGHFDPEKQFCLNRLKVAYNETAPRPERFLAFLDDLLYPEDIPTLQEYMGYIEMFEQLQADGIISTRGLKDDAKTYGELIFDVNSAYFDNHCGYEFAKQFYADAYKAAVEIVGGEQYILSAVMHADERNRAMSEALGEDVFHYHLHVVYIPVVEKQILWSKRCKDKSLVGTVKETIMQVSSSKRWISKPTLDEDGNPVLNSKGKPILRKSYSVLQDDYFNAMRAAGYTDVERGERGSTEEHLTVTRSRFSRKLPVWKFWKPRRRRKNNSFRESGRKQKSRSPRQQPLMRSTAWEERLSPEK